MPDAQLLSPGNTDLLTRTERPTGQIGQNLT